MTLPGRTSTLAPRVGVHVFVVDHVSVGLTAGCEQGTFTTEATREGRGPTTVSNVSRFLRFGPGAGLAYQGSSGFGVWARGALELRSFWATTEPSLPLVSRKASRAGSFENTVLPPWHVRQQGQTASLCSSRSTFPAVA